jgi:hypothetical protein
VFPDAELHDVLPEEDTAMLFQMLILLAGLSPQADLHALAPDLRSFQPSQQQEASEEEIRYALGNNELSAWRYFGGFGWRDDWKNPGSARKWSDWVVRHTGLDGSGGYAGQDDPKSPAPTPEQPKDPPPAPPTPVPEPTTMALLAGGAAVLLRRK